MATKAADDTFQQSSPDLEPCRFYLDPWPEEGQTVMARVTEITDRHSYVTLIEFGEREAVLAHSELSSRRLRSVHKHVRLGQLLCVRVVSVDTVKGYIDVSKRQVEGEKERQSCFERYCRGKTVQGVIRGVGELLGMTSSQQLENMNQQITWKLDTLHGRRTAAYDVFQQAGSNPSVLDDLELDPTILALLRQVIAHRFALKEIKVQGEVEVMCLGKEGVDAIKEALNAGKMAAGSSLPVQILLLAPPLYTVTCVTLTNQRAEAMAAVQGAVAAIEDAISRYTGGLFHVHKQPCMTGHVQLESHDSEADVP